MLLRVFNKAVKTYLGTRFRRIEHIHSQSAQLQENIRRELLAQAQKTCFAKDYGLDPKMSYEAYHQALTFQTYESLWPYIERMMMGESRVLTPGVTQYFAKSAGTTSGKSKYLPINKEMLNGNLINASWDSMATVYHHRPSAQNFQEKNLILGGSLNQYEPHPSTIVGDVSAIMLHTMPPPGRPFYCPDFETALWADWDKKLDRVAEIACQENIVMFAGVPTWNLVLFNKILEISQKKHLLEVWPNLKTYMHGGVGFEPYRESFKRLIPSEDFDYMEIYNASEGYLAIQDASAEEGLLLLTNHSIYFEFIPIEKIEDENPEIIPLAEVSPGKKYALLLSTVAGLWRYMIGDTVEFVSTNPYRIKIVGRTQQYINVFGEEVMIGNTDQAIAVISKRHNVKVRDYTVAPIYMNSETKGGHQWLIEFEQQPADIHLFSTDLDRYLQEINSDYEAKRYGDMALENLQIVKLRNGLFDQWLRTKGKIGAQIKVPRLSNNRKMVDEILVMNNGQ